MYYYVFVCVFVFYKCILNITLIKLNHLDSKIIFQHKHYLHLQIERQQQMFSLTTYFNNLSMDVIQNDSSNAENTIQLKDIDLNSDDGMEVDTPKNVCKTFENMKINIAKGISIIDTYTTQIDKYICLGVPNLYCQKHFDDEDFIHCYLILPDEMMQYITNQNTQSIFSYSVDYIIKNKINVDFKTISNSENMSKNADEVFAKTIYIYYYINNFHGLPNTIPNSQKLASLPSEFLDWVLNLINMIKKFININPLSEEYENMDQYLKELIYGINVIICHVKMVINHHNVLNLPIYAMADKYISKFFRNVNNLCVILIYFKLTIRGFIHINY